MAQNAQANSTTIGEFLKWSHEADRRGSGSQEWLQLKVYVFGVWEGLMISNVALKARQQPLLFCDAGKELEVLPDIVFNSIRVELAGRVAQDPTVAGRSFPPAVLSFFERKFPCRQR